MEIIAIYPPYLYSIKYDGREKNEFDRLLEQWNNVEFICSFLESNKQYLESPIWQYLRNIEEAVKQILDETEALEDHFDILADNTSYGETPDFDSHFKYLDGKKYRDVHQWFPMKSYGLNQPSFLRLYAIKMEAPNTYLITGGGIKLADSIQNSPDLQDHILQDIDRVRQYLKDNGIYDSDDMNEN